jgi:hypothetical protein
MQRKWMVAAAAAGFLAMGLPVWAHHAFAAEFDADKPLKLQGKVTKWELVNPHSWIHLDVKGPDGKVTEWMIEGGSPNSLFRLGFTKDALPPGSEIVVEGYAAKDGSPRAVGASLTFSNGKRLFLSSSAANGDKPGADGAEK